MLSPHPLRDHGSHRIAGDDGPAEVQLVDDGRHVVGTVRHQQPFGRDAASVPPLVEGDHPVALREVRDRGEPGQLAGAAHGVQEHDRGRVRGGTGHVGEPGPTAPPELQPPPLRQVDVREVWQERSAQSAERLLDRDLHGLLLWSVSPRVEHVIVSVDLACHSRGGSAWIRCSTRCAPSSATCSTAATGPGALCRRPGCCPWPLRRSTVARAWAWPRSRCYCTRWADAPRSSRSGRRWPAVCCLLSGPVPTSCRPTSSRRSWPATCCCRPPYADPRRWKARASPAPRSACPFSTAPRCF